MVAGRSPRTAPGIEHAGRSPRTAPGIEHAGRSPRKALGMREHRECLIFGHHLQSRAKPEDGTWDALNTSLGRQLPSRGFHQGLQVARRKNRFRGKELSLFKTRSRGEDDAHSTQASGKTKKSIPRKRNRSKEIPEEREIEPMTEGDQSCKSKCLGLPERWLGVSCIFPISAALHAACPGPVHLLHAGDSRVECCRGDLP